jgi:hypothetical protein
MIPRAHVVCVALLASILNVEFAVAQGAVVAPNGTAGVGAPPDPAKGTAPSPPITGQLAPLPPTAVHGLAEQPSGYTTGLSRAAPDGSTKIVPPRPCSRAARETDGTTTCVGIR